MAKSLPPLCIMDIKEIYFKNFDWVIVIFNEFTPRDRYFILGEMDHFGISQNKIERAGEIIGNSDLNTAFTASNKRNGVTVIGLSKSSSNDEFLSTIEHEIRHVVDHISSVYDLDPKGEEVGYLTGDINKSLAGLIQKELSDCTCTCKECQDYRNAQKRT